MAHQPDKIVKLSSIKVACKDCTIFQLCLPLGIGDADLELLERIIRRRRPLSRGDHLFQMGDPFRAIYAVRAGSVKTYTLTDDGNEQITGFHLPGELVGLDAINTELHHCSAKALETTSLCEIPFDRLEELGSQVPSLQRQLLRIMSKEILTDQTLMMLLGKKSAEARLAAFLLSLSVRFQERRFSPNEFNLSMSRTDISNYLGLAVETVSRLFTRFQREGLIKAQRKHVCIVNAAALNELTGSGGANNGAPKIRA
jgi:CRP/FNR family transcriptional regulator, anaerobic regulatory protein